MTLCSVVEIHQSSTFKTSILKMEAICSSEATTNFYHTHGSPKPNLNKLFDYSTDKLFPSGLSPLRQNTQYASFQHFCHCHCSGFLLLTTHYLVLCIKLRSSTKANTRLHTTYNLHYISKGHTIISKTIWTTTNSTMNYCIFKTELLTLICL